MKWNEMSDLRVQMNWNVMKCYSSSSLKFNNGCELKYIFFMKFHWISKWTKRVPLKNKWSEQNALEKYRSASWLDVEWKWLYNTHWVWKVQKITLRWELCWRLLSGLQDRNSTLPDSLTLSRWPPESCLTGGVIGFHPCDQPLLGSTLGTPASIDRVGLTVRYTDLDSDSLTGPNPGTHFRIGDWRTHYMSRQWD